MSRKDHAKGHHPGHLRALAAAFVAAGVTALVLLAVASGASGSPSDPNFGHKVTICHATASSSNPFTLNDVDVASSGLKAGHQDHAGDIIPPFTYVDKDDNVISYPGKNLTTQYGTSTGAQVLANGCVIPTTQPTDVCPNIDGDQATVPDGLVVDSEGNCVEPNEPPATDVCPNIEGDQATIPDGMYVDADGNCVEPQEAQDVCPNIDGDQATVPDGMYVDGDGNCVEPAPQEPGAGETTPDVCNNIDGNQATVPEGLELVDGACLEVTGGGEPAQPADAETLDGPVVTDANEDIVEETEPAATDAPAATEATTATGTPTGTKVDTTKELPFTGREQNIILGAGIALILAGLVLEFAHRRRPRAAKD